MKIPEHLAMSYLLAQFGLAQEFGQAGVGLALAAGMLPDLDGVSILGGWRCHRKYHRVVGHGLPVTLLGPLALAALGTLLIPGASLPVLWAWLQLSLVLHLTVDLLFYTWPVELLWPFSHWGLGFGLVSWNDLVPTLILYLGTAFCLTFPDFAALAAGASLGWLAGYVAWRARYARPRHGWGAWLSGGWVRRSPRVCRWLTGDFIT